MDEIDIASARMEAWLENRISEHMYQLGHAVSAYEDGRCRNCGEKLEGRNYCDAECAADFEERQRLARMNRKYRGG